MSRSKRLSLFKGALLVFKAQDLKVEQNTEIASVVQKTVERCHVIDDKQRKSYIQTSLDCFFRKVDRIESGKESGPVSASGMSEMVLRLLLLTILQLHHPPPAHSSRCLFTQCQPQSVLFKVLCCRIKAMFFTCLSLPASYVLSVCCAAVLCPVVSDSWQPQNYNPPGSSVHGILQARILEWVAISSSRESSQPRDQTQGSNPGLWHCRRILYRLSH